MGGLIWLASFPKSGNTWVRLFFENLLSRAEFPVDINMESQFCTSEASVAPYLRLEPRTREYFTAEVVAGMRERVQAYYADLADGTLLLKTHCGLVKHLDRPAIATKFTAGAIYIVRNPLDVAPSFARHMSLSLDRAIEYMSRPRLYITSQDVQVGEPVCSWSLNVLSWTRRDHPRLLVVRYEDLLEDPVTHFGRMVDHIGFEASQDELERAIDHVTFDKLRSQEADAGFKEASGSGRFFMSGRAGGWRDTLSHEQAVRIVRDHGAVMSRFGYVPDDLAEFAGKAIPMSRDLIEFDCRAPMAAPGRHSQINQAAGFEFRF